MQTHATPTCVFPCTVALPSLPGCIPGNLILCQPTMAAREATAAKVAAETGATYIPPYDYPNVIAGQGTIGLELLQQASVSWGAWPEGWGRVHVGYAAGCTHSSQVLVVGTMQSFMAGIISVVWLWAGAALLPAMHVSVSTQLGTTPPASPPTSLPIYSCQGWVECGSAWFAGCM